MIKLFEKRIKTRVIQKLVGFYLCKF